MSIKYDKLIRDRVPDVMTAAGKTFRTRVASVDEFEQYALRKLQEELDEFKASLATEELVDVLEVIHAIVRERGLDAPALEQLRAKKAAERGGFQQRLVLIDVD